MKTVLLPLLLINFPFTLFPLAPGFDMEAHRGGRDRRPENTLSAFAYATKLGVTTIELDTAVTKDRVVVVSHNPMLNHEITRTEEGEYISEDKKIFIKDLTFEELQKYDVGMLNPKTRYGYIHRQQKPVPGEKIPALEEVFQLVQKSGNNSIRFNIEMKTYPNAPEYTIPCEEFADLLYKVIVKYNMEKRVTIQSFNWNNLKLFRAIAPHIPIGCLTVRTFRIKGELYNLQPGKDGPSPWLAGLDYDSYKENIPRMVKDFGGDIFSPYYKEVTKKEIEEAHRLGLRVVVWTVNRKDIMRKLISWGVDGIISDRPDVLLDVVKNR